MRGRTALGFIVWIVWALDPTRLLLALLATQLWSQRLIKSERTLSFQEWGAFQEKQILMKFSFWPARKLNWELSAQLQGFVWLTLGNAFLLPLSTHITRPQFPHQFYFSLTLSFIHPLTSPVCLLLCWATQGYRLPSRSKAWMSHTSKTEKPKSTPEQPP